MLGQSYLSQHSKCTWLQAGDFETLGAIALLNVVYDCFCPPWHGKTLDSSNVGGSYDR